MRLCRASHGPPQNCIGSNCLCFVEFVECVRFIWGEPDGQPRKKVATLSVHCRDIHQRGEAHLMCVPRPGREEKSTGQISHHITSRGSDLDQPAVSDTTTGHTGHEVAEGQQGSSRPPSRYHAHLCDQHILFMVIHTCRAEDHSSRYQYTLFCSGPRVVA